MRSAWAVAADLLDPRPPPTFEQLGYTPNCRIVAEAKERGEHAEPCGECPQERLHAIEPFSLGGPFDVLYGGAAFGGKSYGLLMDALHRANTHSRLEAWWVRRTYPELRDSVLTDLEGLDYAAVLGCRWNAGTKELRFPNASIIKFRHARNLADAGEMLSAACQLLVVDERTTLDPAVVQKLTTRVRSGKPGVPVVGVRSGTNPGGPGHSAVKADFIDPAPLGRQRLPALDPDGHPIVTDDGRTLDRYFLPAKIDDNPAGVAADPTYSARFAMMSPDLAAAYRDGDWSRFEGMRFDRFDPRRHIVEPRDLDIPLGGVRRGVGIDYGMAAPFAAVWGAIVNEQLIIYRELHRPGLTPTEQAKAILALEADGERTTGRPVPSWLDPATWARDPEKPLAKPIRADDPPPGSIADRYRKAGVPARKAFNDRVAGWSLLDELLGELPDGRPRMVFSSACPNVIRSLTGAPRSDSDPEDVDGAYRDDHAADAIRYLACGLLRHGVRTVRNDRAGDRKLTALTGGLAKAGF